MNFHNNSQRFCQRSSRNFDNFGIMINIGNRTGDSISAAKLPRLQQVFIEYKQYFKKIKPIYKWANNEDISYYYASNINFQFSIH